MTVAYNSVVLWLSGGDPNTDPTLSLGGVISTADVNGPIAQSGFPSYPTSMVGAPNAMGPLSYDPAGMSLAFTLRATKNATPVPNTVHVTAVGYTGEVSGVVGGGTQFQVLIGNDGTHDVVYFDSSFLYDHDIVPTDPTVVDWSGGVMGISYVGGGSDFFREVTSGELAAGETIYRCFYVQNFDAASLTDCVLRGFDQNQKDTANAGVLAWDWAVGLDPAGVNGTATTIVDEFTAPAGVTFTDMMTTDLTIPTLTTNDYIAVWIRMTIPAGYDHTSDFGPGAVLPGGVSFQIINALGADDQALSYAFSVPITGIAPAEDDLEETVAFTDVAEATVNLIPEDAIAFTDIVDVIHVRTADVEDGIEFSETLVSLHTMTSDITDDLEFSDALVSRAILHADLLDTISFGINLELVGDVNEGWVLNLETDAASKYTWGPFTSFARFQGKHYGVTNEGVFLLEGDDDAGNPIQAFVLLGVSDFEIEFKKRIKAAYLGVRSSGELLLKVVVDEQTFIYNVITSQQNVIRRERAVIGLGLYGNFWQFGIENAEGVDFELESVKILPLPPVADGRRKD